MPIEAKGKKDPALAARMKAGTLPEDEAGAYDYVVGRRALRVGEEIRQPGDPIPEAASWPRLESWLRSGAVVQKPAGSTTVNKPAPARPHRPAPRTQPEPVAQEEKPKSVLRPIRRGASA